MGLLYDGRMLTDKIQGKERKGREGRRGYLYLSG